MVFGLFKLKKKEREKIQKFVSTGIEKGFETTGKVAKAGYGFAKERALEEYHKKYGGMEKPVVTEAPVESLRKDIRSIKDIDVIKCFAVRGTVKSGGVCTIIDKNSNMFQLDIADWKVESEGLDSWNTYFKVKD